MKRRQTQRGFVALMSAIIVSAILIGLMASGGLAGFYARFDALGTENKREALALGESCINAALLALATSTDPTRLSLNDEIVDIGADAEGRPMTCVIKDIMHSGLNATIDAYASSDDSFANLSVTAVLTPSIQIVSWDDSQ